MKSKIKYGFLVFFGLILSVIDYIVYAADCILIAPFPKSTPAFYYWHKNKPENDFKKKSYYRIGFVFVVYLIIKIIVWLLN